MRLPQILSICAISLATLFASATVAQSNYPNKPINFIVPYGAGGSADSRSRQLAQKMSLLLKQAIVIDNKPGAGGNIGTEFIARAAPDGYTIGMGNFAPMAVNKTLFGNLRYDPETDLSPIVLVEKGPLVLVVNPNSPYKTINDIVAAAKAKPGVLTFSSGGIGGSHQLSAELFELNAGISMIHVPYKSGSAALTDLMAGNVDIMFDQMYSAVPSIKAEKLRPIAITSKKRSPLLPNVPSFTESIILCKSCASTGRNKEKHDPAFNLVETLINPPNKRASLLAIVNPRPVPSMREEKPFPALTNGLNKAAICLSSIPGPWSSTENTKQSPGISSI